MNGSFLIGRFANRPTGLIKNIKADIRACIIVLRRYLFLCCVGGMYILRAIRDFPIYMCCHELFAVNRSISSSFML